MGHATRVDERDASWLARPSTLYVASLDVTYMGAASSADNDPVHTGILFLALGLVVMGWVTLGRRRGWKLIQEVGPYSYRSGMVQGALSVLGGAIAVVVGLLTR
jgi:hypothetical protein